MGSIATEIVLRRRTGFSDGVPVCAEESLTARLIDGEDVSEADDGRNVSGLVFLLPPVPVELSDWILYAGRSYRIGRIRRCRDVGGVWRGTRCAVFR